MADTAAVFDHSGAVCLVCRGNLRESVFVNYIKEEDREDGKEDFS